MLANVIAIVSAVAAIGAAYYTRHAIYVANRLSVLVGAAQTCQEYQGRILDLCEKGYTADEIRQLFDLQDRYHRQVMENDCGRVEDVVQVYLDSQMRRNLT